MHPLQNGSQTAIRPPKKPSTGLAGWFTESGDNNIPSYPGADWFNHVIAEFQNALSFAGIPFDPDTDDNLKEIFNKIDNSITPVMFDVAISGTWRTGAFIYIIERRGIFKIVENVIPNGYNIIAITSNNSQFLVLQKNENDSYTPRQFGVPQDGISDCKDSLYSYITSGITYFDWDSGLYNVSEHLPILSGQHHNFKGTKLKGLGENKVLRGAYTDDWSITGYLRLIGTADGSKVVELNDEVLFEIIDCKRFSADNILCLDTLGRGFYFAGNSASRSEKGRLSNCYSYRCQRGWDMEADGSTEYHTLSNCGAVGNFIGVKMAAGNNRWTGGVITDNARNVWLTGGANHLHGKMIGVAINHATSENLLAEDVENGHDFVACDFYGDSEYAGRITLRNSQGVGISNGLLDCRVQVEAGAGTITGVNKVINMTIAGANASFQGDISKLVSYGNVGLGDVDAKAFNRIQPETIPLSGSWTGGVDMEYSPSSNEVALIGVVSGGLDTLIGVVRVGFRPRTNLQFAIDANGAYGSIAVETNGNITLSVGSGSLVRMDNCRWQAWE